MRTRDDLIRNTLFGFFLMLFFFTCQKVSHIHEGKLLDMTYSYDETTIYWPTAKPFQLEKLSWGVSEGGWLSLHVWRTELGVSSARRDGLA